MLREGRIQHAVAEAQCFIEKYETMKACLCQQAPREKDVVTALQNVEHDALINVPQERIGQKETAWDNPCSFVVGER